MCGTNRGKNIHSNVFQTEACYRLQRRGVCNWWRCSRTCWPGFWNPLETKTRPRPKTVEAETLLLLLQYYSTEHFYHSISQPINLSLQAAVKFQKQQQHFLLFIFFLNNIHLSLFSTSVWLFLFGISVTPHSCLVFTSSHRLLCAANLGETLNVEASAINMVFTSLLWVQLHCGSFQTLALRRNGMEISDNAMRRAVVLSTLALIMAKVALWDS